MFAAGYWQLWPEPRPGTRSDGNLGNSCGAVAGVGRSQNNPAGVESPSAEQSGNSHQSRSAWHSGTTHLQGTWISFTFGFISQHRFENRDWKWKCVVMLRHYWLDDRKRTSPFPFDRICFMVLVMRKGGESSWSGPLHLSCTLEVFHVHSYQDQFIQPGWAECVFLCI